MSGPAPRPANRLARETSPYLLQHAHNPVDWYPWGDAAFARAKAEGKPIFLSIGYATCHWCHVMERESFEDDATAADLNARFVCIKVDREERPDVDHVYMTVTQAMTGHGGWPMSVFLTPDRLPIFAGTYFPPEDRPGRPAFRTLLGAIAEYWQKERAAAERQGASIVQQLFRPPEPAPAGALDADPLDAAAGLLTAQVDPVYGGFGGAPKFPTPHQLLFLLRQHRRTGDRAALAAVTRTLDAMADGGIHDQIGGGFHRYATDREWLVPHFEKMLYDQAGLLRAYVEAFQVTGEARFAAVARGIVGYVARDLADPGGAVRSAEDADSEGEEGKFYCWTRAEIRHVCGEADEARLCDAYGVDALGNWVDEAIGHRPGTNILHRPKPLEADTLDALAPARAKLLAVRAKRVRPLCDDKINTAWNGLWIGALARAARALDEPGWAADAARAAEFLLRVHRRDGRLLRTSRGGVAGAAPGFVEDYAFLAEGLLDLFEATGDAQWLGAARDFAREMLARFAPEGGGTLYFTAKDAETLITRPVETYDGATPSGNSAAAMVCLRLGRLLQDDALAKAGERILAAGMGELRPRGVAHTYALCALDLALAPPQEIVLAGDPAAPAFAALRREVDRRFLPHAVVAWHPPGAAGAAVEALLPHVQGQGPVAGRPAAYVCERFACRAPVTDAAALGALLGGQ